MLYTQLKKRNWQGLEEGILSCHRLDYGKNESRNQPKRTIVKFLNRKNCDN